MPFAHPFRSDQMDPWPCRIGSEVEVEADRVQQGPILWTVGGKWNGHHDHMMMIHNIDGYIKNIDDVN